MAVNILEFESPYWARGGEISDGEALGRSLLEEYEDFVVPLDPGEHDLSHDPEAPYYSFLTVDTAGAGVLHFVSKEIPATETASFAQGDHLEPTSVLPTLFVDEAHPVLVCSETHEATGATLVHKVIAYRDF